LRIFWFLAPKRNLNFQFFTKIDGNYGILECKLLKIVANKSGKFNLLCKKVLKNGQK
jgi:hypothetical protein